MTTPPANVDIRIYQIVDTQVTVVSPGLGQSTLFVNLDENNTVYISYYKSMQAGDESSIPVAALGSITLTPTAPMYALCDTGLTAQLLAVPPGTQWAAGPAQIGAALAGLAGEIATEIYETGISVVAAPELLYDVGPSGPTITSRWGGTVYGVTGTPFATAIENFQNLIQRPVQGYKVYNVPSLWSVADIQANAYCAYALANNAVSTNVPITVYLCFKPALDGSDASNLKLTYQHLLTAGFTPNTVRLIYYQEWDGNAGLTASQIKAVYGFYYADAQVHLPGCVTYDPSGAAGTANAQAGEPFPNADIYGFDDYTSEIDNSNITPEFFIGRAHALNVPWAWLEMGRGSGNPEPSDQDVQDMLTHAAGLVTADLDANLPVDGCFWFWNPQTSDRDDPTNFVTQLQGLADACNSGVTPTTINPGAGFTMPPINPSPIAGYAPAQGISYDIYLNLIAGTGSTNPFAKVRLFWYNADDPNARAVDIEQWIVPMGNQQGTQIWGKGPQRGQYVAIQVINMDTVACTLQSQVNSTGRAQQRDNWRWDSINSNPVPGFTLSPDGAGYNNCLGAFDSISVPANTTKSFLCGLYAGKVYIRLGTATNMMVITAAVTPQPPSLYTGIVLLNELLTGPSVSSIGDYTAELILPRTPCVVSFTNSDSSAHTVYGIMISED